MADEQVTRDAKIVVTKSADQPHYSVRIRDRLICIFAERFDDPAEIVARADAVLSERSEKG